MFSPAGEGPLCRDGDRRAKDPGGLLHHEAGPHTHARHIPRQTHTVCMARICSFYMALKFLIDGLFYAVCPLTFASIRGTIYRTISLKKIFKFMQFSLKFEIRNICSPTRDFVRSSAHKMKGQGSFPFQ